MKVSACISVGLLLGLEQNELEAARVFMRGEVAGTVDPDCHMYIFAGDRVGALDGALEGAREGFEVVGERDGAREGVRDGALDGARDGTAVRSAGKHTHTTRYDVAVLHVPVVPDPAMMSVASETPNVPLCPTNADVHPKHVVDVADPDALRPVQYGTFVANTCAPKRFEV